MLATSCVTYIAPKVRMKGALFGRSLDWTPSQGNLSSRGFEPDPWVRTPLGMRISVQRPNRGHLGPAYPEAPM